MKKYFLAVAILFLGFEAFAQHTNNLFANYLLVKDALIAADNNTAANAVSNFVEAIKNDKDFTQKTDLLKALQTMNKSTDIEKQRAAFEKVSFIMLDMVKQSKALNQDVYYK
jgi:hypothetical protein